MKKIITLSFFLVFLLACSTNSIQVRQLAQSKVGVVAAAHPLATQAGNEMLTRGGNAVDAAVAAAFTLSVVEPSMSGLGGRLQAIVHLPDGQVVGVDATSQSPMAYDTAVVKPARFGYNTIGIPGVVAGLTKLLEDYGTLPLETVMAPAIKHAEQGFALLPGEALRQSMAVKEIQQFPGTSQYFLQANGETYPAGAVLTQKDLANTLRQIAQGGRKAFYEGPIAEKIAADIQANGGCVSFEDLKNYQAFSSKIVKGSYRGYDLHGLWLPSFGAITIEALQILENFPLGELAEEDRIAAIYQAMKLAYDDRPKQYEGEHMAKLLCSKEHAASQASKINLDQAQESIGSLYEGQPESWLAEVGHTTHLSAADESGMVIALTQSLGPNMGSKVATQGLGFLYAISLGPYLRIYEPGQRVSSHISPFLVTSNGKPYLGLGAAGGSRIPTAIISVVSQLIDEQVRLDEALAAPRIFPDADSILLEIHPGLTWESQAIGKLKTEGFHLKSLGSKARFGRVHAVLFDAKKGKWIGGADPDWEGAAAGPKKRKVD
jgi:gamma-glutamyltranspeptidase/glutathione hydrolase